MPGTLTPDSMTFHPQRVNAAMVLVRTYVSGFVPMFQEPVQREHQRSEWPQGPQFVVTVHGTNRIVE